MIAVCQVRAKECFIATGVGLVGNREGSSLNLVELPEASSGLVQFVRADAEIWGGGHP